MSELGMPADAGGGMAPAGESSNPMMPQGMEPAPGGPMPPDLAGMMPHMEGQLQRQVSIYDKIKEASARATLTREHMDSLVKLGDMISQEDVVTVAGKLVAAGMGAAEIAGILSEMPEQGEALQGWVMQHDVALRKNEAQLKQLGAQVRHEMGVSAVRLLGAHHLSQEMGLGNEPSSVMAAPKPATGAADGAANELMGGLSNG